MTKVYAIVRYDMLEYAPSPHVRDVYSTREAAEKHLPQNDEMSEYGIKELEVLDD